MSAMKPSLSSGDKSIIARYPLGDALDNLRCQLRTFSASLDSWRAHEMEASMVLTELLVAFMTHATAFHLRLPGSEGNLASDLGQMIERVDPSKSKSIPFGYSHFHPLIQAVLTRKTDVELWQSIFTLVDTYRRPDSAHSFSSTDTLPTLTFPQPPSKAAAERQLYTQALADKVFIADIVQRNEFFFPFKPTARPTELYKEREEFAQAVLRDLDRLYIRIIDEKHDYEAFAKITKGVRSLGSQFALWHFEAVLFRVVKKTQIELADFEVFRGLQAWMDMRNGKKMTSSKRPLPLPQMEGPGEAIDIEEWASSLKDDVQHLPP